MVKIFSGLFDSNEKELKRLQPKVDRINVLEPEFEKLTDEELHARTDEFKARLAEATAGIRKKLAETRKELDEAKQCLAGAALDTEKDEADRQCKRAEEKIQQIEKELRELESAALYEILPEAYAAMREAARRTIGQRAFDVQLLGAITLHLGKIAEMRTGEGKTLTATFPLYLNSLTGRGVHLVTVNDYLARRDPSWMGPAFHALGVSVASIYPMQNQDEQQPARLYDPDFDSGDSRWQHYRPIQRAEAYKADIVYGTSSDFGFDYLRDNMVVDLSRCVQRPLYYSIVDEVDNLLIDEARTPLIISGPAEESGETYQKVARLVPRLHLEEDFTVDEKSRTVNLTDAGITSVERLFQRDGLLKSPNLYDPDNHGLTRYLDNALKAEVIFRRDKDYMVKDGEVLIVDEFTGRLMYGRRYSEGLHQAIEAKEHVKVQRESVTYASVTIQNYFRMYEKLGGMTGTALTEAEEFYKIYKLEVTEIPTNKPMIREDHPDQIYKTEEGKFRAVVREIKSLHEQETPVLVGTVSIEKSELLNDMLKRQGVSCKILNAKEHTQEAEIIAHAGEPGAVTVATNMAGRGVDIILGGAPDGKGNWQAAHDRILSLGGLHIIGTERHEARRIDNQLRGRAGRQGDPGNTQFYVSLEDDIMVRFGGDRIKTVMNWVGMDEDTPIENKMITNAITDVQKRVEGYHFDMRKHLVEYDDVVNKHRELIYEERRKLLSGADLKSNIMSMVTDEIRSAVAFHCSTSYADGWDIPGLLAEVNAIIPIPRDINEQSLRQLSSREVEEKLLEIAAAIYEQREADIGSEKMRMLERLVMLQIIDRLWLEHLTSMDQARLQAGWQTLRQTRSVDAYKRSGYEQFQTLLGTIRHDVARTMFHVRMEQRNAQPPESPMVKAAAGTGGGSGTKKLSAAGKKIGRNDPCPCGSGKKYKHCCGR
ncbi:MAG: preprotein translocase subunit SecA [Dehalococcoidales bacterium]|nr:preprotein translocase subunit SecA [Dehalococcoidales bacterium]